MVTVYHRQALPNIYNLPTLFVFSHLLLGRYPNGEEWSRVRGDKNHWTKNVGCVIWITPNISQELSLHWRHNERRGVSNQGVSGVCSTVCSSAHRRKHQSSASLAFVSGIHQWSVDSQHKGHVTPKMFPSITSSWPSKQPWTLWVNKSHESLEANVTTKHSTIKPYTYYDDVTKWKYFPPYWPFVTGIQR